MKETGMKGKSVVDRIAANRGINYEELTFLLDCDDDSIIEYLMKTARAAADSVYGKDIYTRGLIELTNYCRNDCYYCGIRKSNRNADRYRLTKEEILACAREGRELGFMTFVLQGGEDPWFTDERICDIVSSLKAEHPDCAVTLSLGERSRDSYQRFYDAGADRYLLRHETADEEHYGKLHPEELSLQHRLGCLRDLQNIGYQTGCGFMVGSPYQTYETLYRDLQFIRDFQPAMVGIGPFIPHHDTPFRDMPAGSLDLTLKLLAIVRLIHPAVLLPSTTALATIDPKGREMGILAGCNVVMPNLSPADVRGNYLLYDNKICTGDESAQSRQDLDLRMRSIGYRLVVSRGDAI